MLQKFLLPELRNNASVENSYFPKPMVIFLGAVHKRRLCKIAKNWPPPPMFANVRYGSIPSLLVRADTP